MKNLKNLRNIKDMPDGILDQGVAEIYDIAEALRYAHEAMRWLGRVRTLININDLRDLEMLVMAEACAELHMYGPGNVQADNVRELMVGYDGADERDAITRGCVRLAQYHLIDLKKARLIL